MQALMNPLVNSILSALFVLLGLGAVWIMLDLKGRPRDRANQELLIFLHRAMGWAFVIIFVWMISVMILKVMPYKGRWGIRSSVHATLTFLLLGALIAKVAVARWFKRLTHILPGLGITCFSLALALVAITAGYFFLHTDHVKYVRYTPADQALLDVSWGQQLTGQKCGSCHSLERVFRSFKSEEGWERTVNRMAAIAVPSINGFDVKQIIHYLVTQQERRTNKDEKAITMATGQTLVERKCSMCHNLDRVFKADKTETQWKDTVTRMVGHMGDPAFLADDEKASIAIFLVARDQAGAN